MKRLTVSRFFWNAATLGGMKTVLPASVFVHSIADYAVTRGCWRSMKYPHQFDDVGNVKICWTNIFQWIFTLKSPTGGALSDAVGDDLVVEFAKDGEVAGPVVFFPDGHFGVSAVFLQQCGIFDVFHYCFGDLPGIVRVY